MLSLHKTFVCVEVLILSSPDPQACFNTKRPKVLSSAPVEPCLFLVPFCVDIYCFHGLITVKEEKRSISMLDFLKRQLMISNGRYNKDRDLASKPGSGIYSYLI